ncbi:MAG: hypothetical protein ACK55Z_08690, partial [bacterium]
NRRGFEPAFRAQTDSQSFAQTEAEREPLLSNIKHYSNAPSYPINYPVPNFGVDHDIVETQKSIAAAEKKLKSHFHATFKKPAGHPVNYKVPNFGVDSDIKDTHASLKVAEKEHKHKLYGKSFV